MTDQTGSEAGPTIVVTLGLTHLSERPDLAERRNGLYVAAVERHGAMAIRLDTRTPAAEREGALAAMDGLLMSGGADIHPSRYGQGLAGSKEIEDDRDELESIAWRVAEDRGVPVLGLCRGLQAINVFSGGTLLQDVEGHHGAGWGLGAPVTHPIRLVGGTRLAALLGPAEELEVNAYHHQGILASDLAPGLRAAAWADSSAGPLVEGLEAEGDRFVVGVQCHPERTESTPEEFERLFTAFVEAARKKAAVAVR
ncbi:MAG TPA: gamma-glutamyl-gamma-aminobutyrate hydrolase family protein [Candidatus Limnocylindrales bacterium]|nr:gamma-glutamyl-gamma-aminobutyrate hydrolase family protein [Candidatus Limnocylindrales bacterium]